MVPQAIDEETGLATDGYDRDAAHELLADVESTLFRIGGVVTIAVDRVQVDEFAGQPLAESQQLIVEWRAYSPMRQEEEAPDAPAPVVELAPPDEDEDEEPAAE